MIHSSGTFRYEAEFTSNGFSDSDVVLQGTTMDSRDEDRLVGHHPTIRFWRDRLVLIASEKARSSTRNSSFVIGDAVPLSARPYDRLHVVRTGSGGIGLSLLRENKLVLAIGAVTAVPLGMNINVFERPERKGLMSAYTAETSLEFQVESEQLHLKDRGVTTIGPYEVYIEHCWQDGIPGVDECVSLCGANDPAINIASIRSAVLLGHSDLKITRWDGSEIFAPCPTL